MGYLQTTTGVTTVGNGATLSFSTPICAQLSLQWSGSGSISVSASSSLDGVTFNGPSIGGAGSSGFVGSSSQSFEPIVAIRYTVSSITGTFSISIAAAPSGSQ